MSRYGLEGGAEDGAGGEGIGVPCASFKELVVGCVTQRAKVREQHKTTPS